MIWRLITDDNVSASFGLAADETIAQRVATGASPPTLRLYTYRSHCALAGRFQRIENEIHVDFCRTHGIAINRRPTGGGAIIMGENQLGVALMIPAGGEDTYGRARELMEKFSAGLVWALNQLGVQAQFRRKNDIEVNGRKIAGLGIYRAGNGGLLFHASLLVDLDVPLMLRVLNTPFEKISDKEIATVAARTTTVRREMGLDIALNDVRQKVAEGYATTFKVELAAGDFTADELQHIAQLEREKYLSSAWIFQTTEVADTVGAARMKTAGGLLEVKVTLAGRLLKAVYIAGEHLECNNVPTVPHIILGLHFGRMLGEWRALEMIARHPPKLLGLVILMPLTGTPMAITKPPALEEIGGFFEAARKALPTTPIMLGCARPLGEIKFATDRLAIDAGLNGIAYPAEGIAEYARQKNLQPTFINACCGVTW